MNPPATAPPAAPPPPRSEATPPRDAPGRSGGSSGRPQRLERDRRVLPAALALSLVLHLLALLVSRLFLVQGDGGAPPVQAIARAAPPPGLQVVPLREVSTDVAAPLPTPQPQPDRPPRAAPTTEPPARAPSDALDERAEPGDAVLDALRPRLGDPRLWVGPDAAEARDERARLRAYARLRAWNDSIALADERARRATDWTFTDDEGRRWGVSPGKLHLGDIEIPLPVGFAPSPGQRDELNARIRAWEEIQAQADRAGIRAEFDDRVRAIREQREAARAEADADGG